ncbi:MAG: cytochrome c [Candidatus Tectomicrobia bacterium]|uniref:Cytochrome c n=1 Tax=Tectimicrobiota bacterium TaxID=2528274 RepID=A0A932MME3_UNCTE|nr:cytochrome c [Candidatus Tectomicrobia bacterium]
MRLRIALLAVSILCALALPWPSAGGAAERPLKEQVEAGRHLFDARGCSTCHAVKGRGGQEVRGKLRGPDLTRVTVYASALLGASVMWNHVPLMEEAMREQGLAWPLFRDSELSDLFTYLHSLNVRGGSSYAFQGDARLGAILFGATCQKCHGPVGKGGRLGPDLAPVAASMLGEEEFAGRMLRHAPTMVSMAREAKLTWPTLSGAEMANILAYMRSLRPKAN